MNPRQDKQHALLQTILGEAASELPVDMAGINIQKHLTACEFQEALGSLIELGEHHQVSEQFWWNLKKAAELLELRDLYAPLRQRRLQASRQSAS